MGRNKAIWIVVYFTGEVLASQALVNIDICFTQVMVFLCLHSLAA